MDVCKNFTLSLTGGFQECRNCGREKKFHKLDFENNTIEYVPKTTNNNAAKFQQEKLQQIAMQKQVEEDELRAKACDKFELALRGQFQQCGNCGIEKKYHKLDTSGQVPYQPRQSLTKSVQQNVNKPVAVAEIVQEAMMVQSVKDRVAQMNKNVQKPSEPQFRPSIKKEEVKEKAPGQAEIVTDQVFTSVQDQKSVFNKQRNKKTIEEATHYIREQNQHHQETADFKKAESQYVQSSEQQEDNEEQQQHTYEQHQDQQQYQEEVHQQTEEQHVEQAEEQHVEQVEQQQVEQPEEQQVEQPEEQQQVEQAEEQQVEQVEEQQQVQQPEEDQENQDIY